VDAPLLEIFDDAEEMADRSGEAVEANAFAIDFSTRF
jgi:hypothetical protein